MWVALDRHRANRHLADPRFEPANQFLVCQYDVEVGAVCRGSYRMIASRQCVMEVRHKLIRVQTLELQKS